MVEWPEMIAQSKRERARSLVCMASQLSNSLQVRDLHTLRKVRRRVIRQSLCGNVDGQCVVRELYASSHGCYSVAEVDRTGTQRLRGAVAPRIEALSAVVPHCAD